YTTLFRSPASEVLEFHRLVRRVVEPGIAGSVGERRAPPYRGQNVHVGGSCLHLEPRRATRVTDAFEKGPDDGGVLLRPNGGIRILETQLSAFRPSFQLFPKGRHIEVGRQAKADRHGGGVAEAVVVGVESQDARIEPLEAPQAVTLRGG